MSNASLIASGSIHTLGIASIIVGALAIAGKVSLGVLGISSVAMGCGLVLLGLAAVVVTAKLLGQYWDFITNLSKGQQLDPEIQRYAIDLQDDARDKARQYVVDKKLNPLTSAYLCIYDKKQRCFTNVPENDQKFLEEWYKELDAFMECCKNLKNIDCSHISADNTAEFKQKKVEYLKTLINDFISDTSHQFFVPLENKSDKISDGGAQEPTTSNENNSEVPKVNEQRLTWVL